MDKQCRRSSLRYLLRNPRVGVTATSETGERHEPLYPSQLPSTSHRNLTRQGELGANTGYFGRCWKTKDCFRHLDESPGPLIWGIPGSC